ncbi:MAG: calcium-binding protein [Microcoleaceae cyanobacterium]
MSQVTNPTTPVFEDGGVSLLPPPGANSVQFSQSQSVGGNPVAFVGGTGGADIFAFSKSTSDLEISAGGGNDSVVGGSGSDAVFGGAGNDTVFSGAGDDEVSGDAGDDLIFSGEGNDRVLGGAGSDTIDGGAGNDTIFGGEGADSINGGDGDDVVYGNQDNDFLQGGAGNDIIYGGQGNDTVQGGSGNDTLFGDKGNDRLVDTDGGSDAFGFSFTGSANADTVVGFDAGTDRILLGTDTFASLGASVEASEFTAVDAESQLADADTALVYVRETGEVYFEGELVATFVGNPEITVDNFELF